MWTLSNIKTSLKVLQKTSYNLKIEDRNLRKWINQQLVSSKWNVAQKRVIIIIIMCRPQSSFTSFWIRRTHTDRLFYHQVLLVLSALPMTIGMEVSTYTLRVSSKVIRVHARSYSPVVRSIEVANSYVDILNFSSDEKKFQRAVRDGIFWLHVFDLPHSFCDVIR